MQQQLHSAGQISIFNAVFLKTSRSLFILLLVLSSAISVLAKPGNGSLDKEKPGVFLATVTTNPSSVFFTAVENFPSIDQAVTITILGVSSTAQTTIRAPNFYNILSATGFPGTLTTVTGNGSFTVFIRFTGSVPGNFTGLLTISGPEIITKTVSLLTNVTPNPFIFPAALNFTALGSEPSLPQLLPPSALSQAASLTP